MNKNIVMLLHWLAIPQMPCDRLLDNAIEAQPENHKMSVCAISTK